MLVTNISKRVICAGEVLILPGNTANVPEEVANTPGFKSFEKVGFVSVYREAAPVVAPAAPVVAPAAPVVTSEHVPEARNENDEIVETAPASEPEISETVKKKTTAAKKAKATK